MDWKVEFGLIIIGMILLLFVVPVLIGVCIALGYGATGYDYYSTVIGVVCIIWVIGGIVWWLI